MKRSELKFLRLRVRKENLRPYDKYFSCPVYKQYTTLAMCHHRALVLVKEFTCYEPCKNCRIRLQSFRVIRRPRIIIRHPRRK